MEERELFNHLSEAYNATTHKFNNFSNMVNNIKWDRIFEADGEWYYCLGSFSLIIENIIPFQEKHKPLVLFSDGSIIGF